MRASVSAVGAGSEAVRATVEVATPHEVAPPIEVPATEVATTGEVATATATDVSTPTTAAATAAVLGIRQNRRTRYGNAEQQGSDGSHNMPRSVHFRTPFQRLGILLEQIPAACLLDACQVSLFKITSIKTQSQTATLTQSQTATLTDG